MLSLPSSHLFRPPFLAALALLPLLNGLAGCAKSMPGRCELGIARGDCIRGDASLGHFPNDDAVCQSYGLTPGSESYAVCRKAKARVNDKTEEEIDRQWWGRGPL